MKVLAIVGSAGENSSNEAFLNAIQKEFKDQFNIRIFNQLRELPLFRPEDLKNKIPDTVNHLKESILQSDAIIISTPEYTHNIPAVLKNALEWCTASGEFYQKKVLPITLTPHPPRGEYAMESLLFTLKALDMDIVTQLPLYKTDMKFDPDTCILNQETVLLLQEGIQLLRS